MYQGPLNQDSTDTNEYLFSQFLTAHCNSWTTKKRRKNRQSFLVLIHFCTVSFQWSLDVCLHSLHVFLSFLHFFFIVCLYSPLYIWMHVPSFCLCFCLWFMLWSVCQLVFFDCYNQSSKSLLLLYPPVLNGNAFQSIHPSLSQIYKNIFQFANIVCKMFSCSNFPFVSLAKNFSCLFTIFFANACLLVYLLLWLHVCYFYHSFLCFCSYFTSVRCLCVYFVFIQWSINSTLASQQVCSTNLTSIDCTSNHINRLYITLHLQNKTASKILSI
jgi:hypothetical protein